MPDCWHRLKAPARLGLFLAPLGNQRRDDKQHNQYREAETRFGGYSVTFRHPAPDAVEITRSFRIPVQVVAPENYEEFSRFARQIDDAERQRRYSEASTMQAITLRFNSTWRSSRPLPRIRAEAPSRRRRTREECALAARPRRIEPSLTLDGRLYPWEDGKNMLRSNEVGADFFWLGIMFVLAFSDFLTREWR